MKLDLTLRTAETQARYQSVIASGKTNDIAKLKGTNIGGLKILENEYGLDMLFKDNNDMLIDKSGNPYEFWHRFIDLYLNAQLPYDGFWLNNLHKKSQGHIEHIHGLDFDREKVEIHRKLWTMYINGEIKI